MALWLMWAIGVVVVVLPFVLMVAFNGTDEADGRGRRISRRWHA
ncbi:MAG: hypothetical protein ACRDZO_21825 [Egibacteraceae bacterium]